MKFTLTILVAYATTFGLAVPHVRSYLARVSDIPQRREIVDVFERDPSYEAELEELDFSTRQIERKPSRHEYREDTADQANLRRMDIGMLFGDITSVVEDLLTLDIPAAFADMKAAMGWHVGLFTERRI